MERSPQTYTIVLDKEVPRAGGTFKKTQAFIGSIVGAAIHVTNEPIWIPGAKKQYNQLESIYADNMLILNLNHINAYGHIYTEVMSELLAVGDTYLEYDCILTNMSPLMASIIDCFSLKFSDKIKFISNGKEIPPFILEFERLKIVNHSPKSFINKVENILKLKRAMHAAVPIINKPKNLLLYCSRCDNKTAKHGRRLTAENEERVIQVLEQHALEAGLEFYFWSGTEPDGTVTPILKQYELYTNAKLVVGVHGGSFSNLIFLDPAKSPKVIEFCPVKGKSFYNLSNAAFAKFADYHIILFESPADCNLRRAATTADLMYVDSTIDIEQLKQTLISIN